MKRNSWINIFLGIVSTILLTISGIIWMGEIVRPLSTDSARGTIRAFHELPEESVEVMVFGSSCAWKGVNVMEMYQKYGIGAYNYGLNWQNINTTALFIYDALRTQTPKVILIETDAVGAVFQDADMNGEIYYTREIPDSEYKQKYLDQCFGNNKERMLTYRFPLITFHENWKQIEYSSINYEKTLELNKQKSLSTMGYEKMPSGDEVPNIGDYTQFEQWELSDESKQILDEICEMCKAKNVSIVFFTIPAQGEYHFFDAVQNYADEHDAVYVNLYPEMEAVGLDIMLDYSDTHHLAESGAIKVADYMGQYLWDHYNLSDMRLQENNLWQKNIEQ